MFMSNLWCWSRRHWSRKATSGWMTDTSTPWRMSSKRRASDRPSMACFVPEYMENPGSGLLRSPAELPTLIIRPEWHTHTHTHTHTERNTQRKTHVRVGRIHWLIAGWLPVNWRSIEGWLKADGSCGRITSSGFEEREEGADGVDHADEVDVKLLLAVLPRLPLQLAADAVRRRVDQRPQT